MVGKGFSVDRYSMTIGHSESFTELTRDYRDHVNRALEQYTQFGGDCPTQLGDAIRHSLLAPGKRLRPILVFMAAGACGADWRAATPAACAVEMVHTYSLIHDDLPAMDDDDLRRGRPSCHAMFGEAMAILAGDALLALAFEILARDTQPTVAVAPSVTALAGAAGPEALVGGQADDLKAPTADGDLEMLESIHRRKTGAMFRVALQLGALVAGADGDSRQALDVYAQRLGLAFQIVDDLLDRRGDAAALGKHTGKDAAQGKLTFPGLLGEEASARRARQLIEEACAALTPLEPRADELRALARFVVERTR